MPPNSEAEPQISLKGAKAGEPEAHRHVLRQRRHEAKRGTWSQ
jgi:hypothetical protein